MRFRWTIERWPRVGCRSEARSVLSSCSRFIAPSFTPEWAASLTRPFDAWWLSWSRPQHGGGGPERRLEASSRAVASRGLGASNRGGAQDEPDSVVRCGVLVSRRDAEPPIVLISTSVQQPLTRRRLWSATEEWNVERFVRDSRDGPRDLGRRRCRHPCDGLRVAGESGDGRRDRDRRGLESTLQRERRTHADDGERDELQRRARAAVVVGRAELPDNPRE